LLQSDGPSEKRPKQVVVAPANQHSERPRVNTVDLREQIHQEMHSGWLHNNSQLSASMMASRQSIRTNASVRTTTRECTSK
ncbi:hypothetical protein OSTOST_18707, partial [Ostertagia ostertagi]